MTTYSYLALGDSYTIGEQVLLTESFPYQTVQLLRKPGKSIGKLETAEYGQPGFAAPEIIAKTGWTTGELIDAIGKTIFLPEYHLVSLLIGVNNQYRGLPINEFEEQFGILLQMAIQFAAGIPGNVYVLSIPDWGVTPFAKDRDVKQIANEINDYNTICEKVSLKFKTNFIDITTHQRIDGDNAAYLAADGLHPSGLEYQKWATKLSQAITENLM